MQLDPTRMCELLVGLPAVRVLGIVDEADGPLWVHVETRGERPACGDCGGAAAIKERPLVALVDLPAFGRPTRLVWRKHRWSCLSPACSVGSWTEDAPTIAAARLVMTDRAGRWATEQVGRWGRTVNEVAVELGCDWHTINDTVIAYVTALVDDDPDRIGTVSALGLDETLFVHVGRWRRQLWCTSIVDVRVGRLLDIVPGRGATEPCAWLAGRGQEWLGDIDFATLDLSGPYRSVFDTIPRCGSTSWGPQEERRAGAAGGTTSGVPQEEAALARVAKSRRLAQAQNGGDEPGPDRPPRPDGMLIPRPRPLSQRRPRQGGDLNMRRQRPEGLCRPAN